MGDEGPVILKQAGCRRRRRAGNSVGIRLYRVVLCQESINHTHKSLQPHLDESLRRDTHISISAQIGKVALGEKHCAPQVDSSGYEFCSLWCVNGNGEKNEESGGCLACLIHSCVTCCFL